MTNYSFNYYLLFGIAIATAITFALRAFPFVLMRVAKRYDHFFCFLSRVMPAGIMVILAVYSAVSLKWADAPQSAVSAVALIAVITLEHLKRQPLLSIGLGLVIYVTGQSLLTASLQF